MVEVQLKREQEDVQDESGPKKLKLQHGDQTLASGDDAKQLADVKAESKSETTTTTTTSTTNPASIKEEVETKPNNLLADKADQQPNDNNENVKQQIVKQLNYYFSDANIVRDKFLAEQFKLDEGWVKITILLTFKRLQAICNNPETIVKAIEDVNSDLIELDESKQKIRRIGKIPNRDDLLKEFEKRTVHVSGFPMDYTFDMLEKYMNQYGSIQSLQMRTHFKTRAFKGCVHVIFEQEADAKKVLEATELKCKDRELRKESMSEYHRRKKEIAEKRKEKKKSASK